MTEHAHHYILDEPSGRHTTGTCKYCGATRTYRNADDDWISSEAWNGRSDGGLPERFGRKRDLIQVTKGWPFYSSRDRYEDGLAR